MPCLIFANSGPDSVSLDHETRSGVQDASVSAVPLVEVDILLPSARSGDQDASISAVPLVEVDILPPSPSQLETGVTLVLVPDPAQAVLEASFLISILY